MVEKLEVISPWKAGSDNVLRDTLYVEQVLDLVKKCHTYPQVIFKQVLYMDCKVLHVFRHILFTA